MLVTTAVIYQNKQKMRVTNKAPCPASYFPPYCAPRPCRKICHQPWTDPAPSKTAKPQRRGQRPTAATATGPAGAATAAVRKSVRTRRKPAVYVPPAPPASAFRGVAAVRGSSASVPVRKSLRTMSRTSPSYRVSESHLPISPRRRVAVCLLVFRVCV